MSNLQDALSDLASAGEQRYATVATPFGYAGEFVNGVRRSRQRRRAMGAVVAVAVIGVSVGVGMSFGAADPVPAAVPGHELWRADLLAESWSSPAFVDGVLIAGTDNGAVRGFDARTGAQRWELFLSGDVRADITPVDGGVIVVDDDGVVARIGSGGGLEWTTSVDGGIRSRDAYDQVTGAAVVVGAVAVVAGHSGSVLALDVETGAPLWTADAGAPVSATVAIDDATVYVADTAGVMHALRLSDGAELWAVELAEGIYSSPGVVGDVVVTGSRGTAVVGLDAHSGEELWRVRLGTSWAESSVEVHGDTAFVGSSNSGAVLAIEGASGEVLWRADVGGWPWARPTYADGQVFATTAWLEGAAVPGGSFAVLDADNGTGVWGAMVGGASTWDPDGAVAGAMASPAVADGLVAVVGLDGSLRVFAR